MKPSEEAIQAAYRKLTGRTDGALVDGDARRTKGWARTERMLDAAYAVDRPSPPTPNKDNDGPTTGLLMEDDTDEALLTWLDDFADCFEGEPTNTAWNLQTIAKRMRALGASPPTELSEDVREAIDEWKSVATSAVAAWDPRSPTWPRGASDLIAAGDALASTVQLAASPIPTPPSGNQPDDRGPLIKVFGHRRVGRRRHNDLSESADGEPNNYAWNLSQIARRLRASSQEGNAP